LDCGWTGRAVDCFGGLFYDCPVMSIRGPGPLLLAVTLWAFGQGTLGRRLVLGDCVSYRGDHFCVAPSFTVFACPPDVSQPWIESTAQISLALAPYTRYSDVTMKVPHLQAEGWRG
jgi:hypothetical protein